MFKYVRLADSSGGSVAVFTGCGSTGYSAKDVMTMPGVYDECLSNSGSSEMSLVELGVSALIKEPCYALAIKEISPDMLDYTSTVTQLASLPATTAGAMMQDMAANLRDDIKQAQEALAYYSTVKVGSKVCLPDEVMASIPEDVARNMRSARQTYVLRATENQEVFQKTPDSEFCIRLPSLDEIHHEGLSFKFSNLDILRVTMPYRRPGTPSLYEPIYHTPYFKVGQQMGMVPQYLQWLEGYASNDLLDIQSNERQMFRNLYTLYQSDVSHYVDSLVTGVFLNTNFGAKLARLKTVQDREVIDRLVAEISAESAMVADGEAVYSAKCSLEPAEINELWDRGWHQSEVGDLVKRKLSFDDGYLIAVVKSQHPAKRVVATDGLLFTLSLTEEQEQTFTDLFIEMGFMSHSLHDFFLQLCQRAYEVSWGHTGSARAIAPLVYNPDIPIVAKEFTAYLNAREAGKAPIPEDYMSLYRNSYSDPTVVDDDAEVNVFSVSGDDDESEFVGSAFDYYVTKLSQGRMLNGEVGWGDLQEAPVVMDDETRKIERWRTVNGNSNLVYFLTDSYMRTADVKIYIQAFIKLLRWGDRRPKVLALQDHPEIRMVFDMCMGSECDNTAIVDEAALVKSNGCDYSLAGFLNSTTNNDINAEHIIGFILEKNYGTVVKQYLTSWEDLAEMVSTTDINIGDFKVMARVDTSPEKFIPIESFEKKSYEIYESDKSIQEGLKWKIRGREMSCLFLLPRPGITSDRSYIRSSVNDTVALPIDKKYDNLRQYIENIKRFYRTYGEKLASIKTTADLQDLATLFDEIAKAGSGSKKDHNDQAASSALSKMSLDLGSSAEIEYSTAELTGRFVLVNDANNLSIKDDTWDKIPFSNPNVRKVADRPKTAIVLLMLKTADCWLLCRKDISASEVDVVVKDGARKINSESYTRLKPSIDALLQGKPATYNGMPLKLHISAKLER